MGKKCVNTCKCPNIILLVLGALGLLAYFKVYALPYLEIVWPVVVVLVGGFSLTGINCPCGK